MKKYLACLVLMFIFKSLYSKCGLPADFTFTVYDTAVVFYLTGGSTNASYYYDFGDGTQSKAGTFSKGISHKYKTNARYNVTMYYYDPVSVCRDTVVKQFCYFKVDDVPILKRSQDTLFAEMNCLPNAQYVWYLGTGQYGYGCKLKVKMPEKMFYQVQLITIKDTPTGCSYYPLPPGEVMDFTDCGFTASFNYSAGQESIEVFTNPKYDDQSPTKGLEIWYWGDGASDLFETIGVRNIKHAYSGGGSFSVCHVLKDSSLNCVDSFCHSVKIDSCTVDPSFNFSVNDDIITVSATGNAVDWKWYNEGNLSTVNRSSTRIYALKNGKNRVCLEARSYLGCEKLSCKDIDVLYCGSLNEGYLYKWTDEDSCEILNIRNSNSRFTTYHWEFGDGATSDLMSVRHWFKSKGTFDITLNAYDSNAPQCNKSIKFQYYNPCDDCKMKCKLTLTYNNIADGATILNESIDTRRRVPAQKHLWNFGDGQVSNEANPTHLYNKSGLYKVKYICSDASGDCMDSIELYIVVDNGKTPFALNVDYYPFGVGITDPLLSGDLKCYPIPFSTQLTIEGRSFSNLTSVKVYNNLGQQVKVSMFVSDGQLNLIFDPTLNSGIYNVVISDGEFNKSVKVVKE